MYAATIQTSDVQHGPNAIRFLPGVASSHRGSEISDMAANESNGAQPSASCGAIAGGQSLALSGTASDDATTATVVIAASDAGREGTSRAPRPSYATRAGDLRTGSGDVPSNAIAGALAAAWDGSYEVADSERKGERSEDKMRKKMSLPEARQSNNGGDHTAISMPKLPSLVTTCRFAATP